MKTTFLKRAVPLVLCLLRGMSTSWGQTCTLPSGCSPVTNPDPYIENTGIAGLERYLARSIYMGGLPLENTSLVFSNSTVSEPQCNLTGPSKSRYCPSRYCQDINMLADLNASFILSVGGRWGAELTIADEPANHSDYRAKAAQVVQDINHAYDCKGQRHPIIQASIFEYISTNPPYTNDIDQIHIPAAVILDYENEMSTAEHAYYFSAPGTPNPNVKFVIANVGFPYSTGGYSPDYSKIEGRMWFHYLARTYIDFGYTALHVGQPAVWGKLDQFTAAGQPAQVHNMLNQINTGMEKMRQYATSKGQTLVIMAEPASVDSYYYFPGARNFYYGTDAEYNSPATRKLIFDYKGVALRPMEIVSDAQIAADNGTCTSAVPAYGTMFNGTACAGLNNAILAPCNGYGRGQTNTYGPDNGGISHLNQQNYARSPEQIGFDFGNGFIGNGSGGTYPWGGYTPGREGTWGTDDAHWFTSELSGSPSCQGYWIASQLEAGRLVKESSSFFSVPGWLPAFNGESQQVGSVTTTRTYPDFYLSNTPAAVSAVQAKWDVSTPPDIQIGTNSCDGVPYGGFCSINGEKVQKRLPSITMTVTNPSPSSIYTWHILNQTTNVWQPMTYGTSRVFTPSATGTYLLGLRQDDLGLPASAYGSRGFDHYITITSADVSCCEQQRAAPQKVAFDTQTKEKEVEMVRQSLAAKTLPATFSPAGLSVDVFPNPAAATISITIISAAQNPIKATILNALGQQVRVLNTSGYQSGRFELDYDLSKLPQGVYFLRVSQGSQQQTVKVVRN